mmetsp:Transcript_1212/g.1852  ORF Transcript_1212/g.1852 Transcript_1212/m.1852 type:complete len:124 (-) Transcript_1212:258-629(-)
MESYPARSLARSPVALNLSSAFDVESFMLDFCPRQGQGRQALAALTQPSCRHVLPIFSFIKWCPPISRGAAPLPRRLPRLVKFIAQPHTRFLRGLNSWTDNLSANDRPKWPSKEIIAVTTPQP